MLLDRAEDCADQEEIERDNNITGSSEMSDNIIYYRVNISF